MVVRPVAPREELIPTPDEDRALEEFFPVVMHQNPACGTSRNVLAIIRAAGYQPVAIEYLETGWTRS